MKNQMRFWNSTGILRNELAKWNAAIRLMQSTKPRDY